MSRGSNAGKSGETLVFAPLNYVNVADSFTSYHYHATSVEPMAWCTSRGNRFNPTSRTANRPPRSLRGSAASAMILRIIHFVVSIGCENVATGDWPLSYWTCHFSDNTRPKIKRIRRGIVHPRRTLDLLLPTRVLGSRERGLIFPAVL